MSQCQAIKQHLQRGELLTPLIAVQLYGTLALHSRIAELRGQGNIINCEIIRTSSGKHVGSYTLERIAYG